MRHVIVLVSTIAIVTLPAQAANYQIKSSASVNSAKILQLGAVLYPSLTIQCTDDAIFAKVPDPNLPEAERDAAEKKHVALIETLPYIKRHTSVFVTKIAEVTCSGPDVDSPAPIAFIRVIDGNYRNEIGWISAEAIPK